MSASDAAVSMRAGIDAMQPGGGTEMGRGMDLALQQLRSSSNEGARRMIVLTDGETFDEDRCQSLAKTAAAERVPISAYGLGSEWNRELLTLIAEMTHGHVDYIQSAADVGTALAGEFKDLQDTALVDAEIVVAPTEGVAVRSLHRVIPDVVDYALSGTSEITASVGDISRDPRTAPRYLLDLVLPSRPQGAVRIARVSLRYREAGDAMQRQTDHANVVVTYTIDRGQASMIDPEIKALIDQREANRMVAKAEEAVRRGDVAKATTPRERAQGDGGSRKRKGNDAANGSTRGVDEEWRPLGRGSQDDHVRNPANDEARRRLRRETNHVRDVCERSHQPGRDGLL